VNKRRQSINLLPLSHDFMAAMTDKPNTTTDTRPSRQIHAITITENKNSALKRKELLWMTF
jgi:hypothetical protein